MINLKHLSNKISKLFSKTKQVVKEKKENKIKEFTKDYIVILINEFYQDTTLGLNIASIESENTKGYHEITMVVRNPGVFIGVKGQYIAQLSKYISERLMENVKIYVKDIRNYNKV